jgi:peptidyl-prolyl cis-trans isomerase B (cyclophilin B)
MQAVLETSRGQIVLEFYADLAPSHVKYFAGLVKTGFYDGTTFHRVILRGIVQGGDPLSKDPTKKSLYGTGGLKKLKPEFSKQPHIRGTVSAVLAARRPQQRWVAIFICVSDSASTRRSVFGLGPGRGGNGGGRQDFRVACRSRSNRQGTH